MDYVNKNLAKVPYWCMQSIVVLGLIFMLLTIIAIGIHYNVTSQLFLEGQIYNVIGGFFILLITVIIIRVIGDTAIIGLKVDKYSRNKQYSKAESVLDKKIKSSFTKLFKRRKSKLLNMKVLLYLRSEELIKGIQISTKLLKQDPSFAKGWYLRGVLKSKLRNMDGTYHCLKKSFNLYYEKHKIERRFFEYYSDKSVEENFIDQIKQDEDLKDFVESEMYERLKNTLEK